MRSWSAALTMLVPLVVWAGPPPTEKAKAPANTPAAESPNPPAPAQPPNPQAPGAAPQAPAGQPKPSGSEPPRDLASDPLLGSPMDQAEMTKSWHYSSGKPIEPLYVRGRSQRDKATDPNPIGFYSGVRPGNDTPPPIAAKTFGSSPAVLTWMGFERTATGSRVFFQLNAEVEHRLEQKGLTIMVRLPNTTVNVKNNRRPLDLRFFNTPVRLVTLRHVGSDAVATISLKREAAPSRVSLVPGASGYKLLVLEFPRD